MYHAPLQMRKLKAFSQLQYPLLDFQYLVSAGLSKERGNWCMWLSHIPQSHSAVSTPCHHLRGTMPCRLPKQTTLDLSFLLLKM